MKIAITGGAGYIGCRLSDYFLKEGHEVLCIDWLKWGISPILNLIDHPCFSLYVTDIRDKEVEKIINDPRMNHPKIKDFEVGGRSDSFSRHSRVSVV